MPQLSRRRLDRSIEKRMVEVFLDSFVYIHTREEAKDFLGEFLTPTERVMLSKRLTIAYLLLKDYDYRVIKDYLKVSFTTINRVSIVLKSQRVGLSKIFQRLQQDQEIDSFFTVLESAISLFIGPKGKSSRYIHGRFTNTKLGHDEGKKVF